MAYIWMLHLLLYLFNKHCYFELQVKKFFIFQSGSKGLCYIILNKQKTLYFHKGISSQFSIYNLLEFI